MKPDPKTNVYFIGKSHNQSAKLKKDSFEKIKALLTPEQLQKLEELKKKGPRSKVLGAH